jgi:hypothetical protein
MIGDGRMEEHDIRRKLATIVVTGIVGFSRLTAHDEDRTIHEGTCGPL